jgi:hypothetical protein
MVGDRASVPQRQTGAQLGLAHRRSSAWVIAVRSPGATREDTVVDDLGLLPDGGGHDGLPAAMYSNSLIADM